MSQPKLDRAIEEARDKLEILEEIKEFITEPDECDNCNTKVSEQFTSMLGLYLCSKCATMYL